MPCLFPLLKIEVTLGYLRTNENLSRKRLNKNKQKKVAVSLLPLSSLLGLAIRVFFFIGLSAISGGMLITSECSFLRQYKFYCKKRYLHSCAVSCMNILYANHICTYFLVCSCLLVIKFCISHSRRMVFITGCIDVGLTCLTLPFSLSVLPSLNF